MMHIAKFLSSHFLGDPISTVKSGSSGVKGKGSRKKQKVESESQSESESEDDDDSSSSEEESSSSDDDAGEPSKWQVATGHTLVPQGDGFEPSDDQEFAQIS